MQRQQDYLTTQRRSRRLWFFGVIVIALSISFVILYYWPKDQHCNAPADPLRVTIGGIDFHVPATYRPSFNSALGYHGFPVDKAPRPQRFSLSDTEFRSGYCQEKASPPMRESSMDVFLSPKDLLGVSDGQASSASDGKLLQPADPYMLSIVEFYKGPNPTYCNAYLARLFSLDDKRIFKGNRSFLEFGGDEMHYYISHEATLFGNPSVIRCSPVDGEKFQSCRLLGIINSAVDVGVGFNTGSVPAKEWHAFIRATELTVTKMFTSDIDPSSLPNCTYMYEKKSKSKISQ